MAATRATSRIVAALAALACAACGPSVDDQVAQLAAGTTSEETRQALLLAKERAVTPLLAALARGPDAAGRAAIARVLAGLLMRTEDARIEQALLRLLAADPDAVVRADVARQLGLQRRRGAVAPLAAALHDTSGAVRQEALTALGRLKPFWGQDTGAIQERTRQLARDLHPGTRVEAMVMLSAAIQERLGAARQAALAGDLVAAESTLVAALAWAPRDRRAAYALGRHYLDNGEPARGQEVLRAHGMLLDVPVLSAAPRIDGVVDEAVWRAEAAHVDSFWQLSREHEAALPTERHTQLAIGWRPEALYLAMVCHDDAPQDLVVGVRHDDDLTDDSWREDRVELFFDTDFDHEGYVQVCINSIGANYDASYRAGSNQGDVTWTARGAWAAAVGADRWSAEVRLDFGASMPRPAPGAVWGANFVRCYRGQEFLQWARTSGNAMQPNGFGLLRF